MSMSDIVNERRAAFSAWLERHGLTVASVAATAGVPATTLYSYLTGKSDSLKGTTQEKISTAFRVSVETLFSQSSPQQIPAVGVWGKIGVRAEVFTTPDYREAPMYEIPLPATLDPCTGFIAFEIDGFSMPPAEPGWIAVFRQVQLPLEELLNTVCLVNVRDGRRLFKRLRRGYAPGRYNLESWDGSPLIEDVEVVSALPFEALTPGKRAK